jgi:hypothetical protein
MFLGFLFALGSEVCPPAGGFTLCAYLCPVSGTTEGALPSGFLYLADFGPFFDFRIAASSAAGGK